MQRLPDWRRRLTEFITENRNTPHEPGVWDCALGVANGALMAVRGEDFGAAYRGRYTTIKEGYALLREIDGVATPRGLASKRLGRSKPPAFARAGDIVCDAQGALGVFYAGEGWFAGEEQSSDGALVSAGFITIPRNQLKACWHV
ncbi:MULTISPECIES: DUF6950 family protein [Hyphobacterium]|uniref:DUF6950 family protein n=1 Tax=Hyphobacterium vulgare TaxID=1736751 RepID=A0ABV6ZU79_9PROT